MCYEIYIASDQPLKTIDWDDNDRKLNVNKLETKDKIIQTIFSKPYIYYIGSHLKCGCFSCIFLSVMCVVSDFEEMIR